MVAEKSAALFRCMFLTFFGPLFAPNRQVRECRLSEPAPTGFDTRHF